MANEEIKQPKKGQEKGEEKLPEAELSAEDWEEIHNEDFQAALKALLDAYRPILEEELERSKDPEKLKAEAKEKPPDCGDELALANRIFDKFFTEKVAVQLLPSEGRQQLGPIDRWRWCFLHLRCCIIFGWLVCRRPQTFRGFVYYLYRYWLCVRRVLGNAPDDRQLNDEERQDFAILVKEFARAYKPYLTDQLATVEYPEGLPKEVLEGEIDCFEGEEETAALYERALTMEAVRALLGSEAFKKHSQEPFFWFCRCWCLCSIRFGCCLARARNLIEVLRCLLYYWRCIRRCFQPLHCSLTAPTGCAEEQPNLAGLSPEMVGLEIQGSAAGAFFSHYILEWRLADGRTCDDDTGWSSVGVVYPGGGTSGTVAVSTGTLGVLETTFLSSGTYEIRVCVYPASPSISRTCCCIQFLLFKKLVWISRVADLPGAPVQIPPGPFLGNTPIVNPAGLVVPVGGNVHVKGAAFVGECVNRKIKCFDLRAAVGWHPGPEAPGFAATLPLYTIPMLNAPICYDDPDPVTELRKRAQVNRRDDLESMLTVFWQKRTIGTMDFWKLKPRAFRSHVSLPLTVSAGSPACPDPHHRCRSGKYTLLLEVEDTLGNFYYDTQQVWFDNKRMTNNVHVVFEGIEGLGRCTELHITPADSPFVPPGAPCGVPWHVNLLGIAYDEYIDETDLSYPSDNFDFYRLNITKQGGPVWHVPISISPDPADNTHGLLRRGQPGQRCEPLPAGGPACPPAQVVPGRAVDVLTSLDMRAFDEVCVSSIMPASSRPPAGFALKRGTCCGYSFRLFAQDKTWSNGWSGGFHRAWSLPWAVCICNDLPEEDEG